MIIQITNIVSGFILSAPKLKELIEGKGAEHIVSAETKLNVFRGTIGVIELVLGAVALVERLGIFYGSRIGSSFPQAFVALACGALLAPHLFEKYPTIRTHVEKNETIHHVDRTCRTRYRFGFDFIARIGAP